LNSIGHVGFALMVLSPLGTLTSCLDATYSMLTPFIVAGFSLLSTIPDVDLKVPLLKHRGTTHSLLAALAVAALLALIAPFKVKPMVFVMAFCSVYSHVVADAITYVPVPAFYPLSRRRVALRIVRASSLLANLLPACLGFTAFTLLVIVNSIGAQCQLALLPSLPLLAFTLLLLILWQRRPYIPHRRARS
jgi:inner membrane protein